MFLLLCLRTALKLLMEYAQKLDHDSKLSIVFRLIHLIVVCGKFAMDRTKTSLSK